MAKVIIKGRFKNADGRDFDVSVYAEGDKLIIEDRISKEILDRWSFFELNETLNADGSLELQSPPLGAVLFIADPKALAKAPWSKRLPHKHHHSRPFRRGVFWILLVVSTAYGLVHGLPIAAKKVPWNWEKKIFENQEPFNPRDICLKTKKDKHTALDELVKRLYPVEEGDKDFSIEVSIVRDEKVNAFAFLAGKIYVYDGLIQKAESPEEVAGAIAHEIEHVKQRHISEGILRAAIAQLGFRFIFSGTDSTFDPSTIDSFLRLKFNRDQERQADEGALERLKRTKVSVLGFKHFFERMQKQNESLPDIFSDHPADSSRIQLVEGYLDKTPTTPIFKDAKKWAELKRSCKP